MKSGGGIGIGTIVVVAVVGLYLIGNHQTSTTNNKVQIDLSSVPLGSSLSYVKQVLGKPDSVQHSESQFEGVVSVSDYLYYGDWQFGFDNGKLTSRSKF